MGYRTMDVTSHRPSSLFSSPTARSMLTGSSPGIEFVRHFQSTLYTETHKWKSDAMAEIQTTNTLFRESSDVIRLKDVWYASRNVSDMICLRARIAHHRLAARRH